MAAAQKYTYNPLGKLLECECGKPGEVHISKWQAQCARCHQIDSHRNLMLRRIPKGKPRLEPEPELEEACV